MLRSDKKEHWPDILDTGKKYQVPCQATRATLPAWHQAILANPGLLVGSETFQGDRDYRRENENTPKNKRSQRGSSSETERGSHRSRSPCAVGSVGPVSPSQTPPGDQSY